MKQRVITFKPSRKQFEAWKLLTDRETTELGYGGAACFAGSTLVLTSLGYKQIRDIQPGEIVLSFNEAKQSLEWKRVINAFSYGGCTEKQKVIELDVYGESIITTRTHRFYIGGAWVPIGEFAKRVLEKSGDSEGLVLDINNGKAINEKMEGERTRRDHEACIRREGLSSDNDRSCGRKNKDNKDAPTSCQCVHTESREQTTNQPQEPEEGRQQSGKLGVGDESGELGSLQRSRGLCEEQQMVKDESATELSKRLRSGNVAPNRRSGQGNQEPIYSPQDGEKSLGGNVWRLSSDDQGHHFEKELEACGLDALEINSIEFKEYSDKVYDLEVEDNSSFIVSKSNIVVHNSGGKSYLGCFWLLAMCLAYPDTGWLLGRKEMINLKRTTLITFFKVCAEYGIEANREFSFNQQTNVITFSNKSQIFLFDLSHQPSDPLYTRLGSLELTGGFVDESNEVDSQAISIVKTRLGRRKNEEHGLTPKLLETFNPDKGHVYQEFYKPFRDNLLPSHRKFIKALPTDNPHTTAQYLQQLRHSDKITQERLLLGNFEYDDDPARLMQYDALNDLWTNTVDQNSERYIVADIARYGQDKTVVGYFEGLDLKQVQTYEKQGTDETAEVIKIMARDERVPFSHILIDEDGIGGGVLDQLRGVKGFIANSVALPNKQTHKPENYQNLKAQCTYTLAEYVNQHRLAISYKDATFKERLIEELEQIKSADADKDGKRKIQGKDEIKAILGRSPDNADMLMMRMWFELNQPGQTSSASQSTPQGFHAYGRPLKPQGFVR